MAEGPSYWTLRRKVRKRVAIHLNDLEGTNEDYQTNCNSNEPSLCRSNHSSTSDSNSVSDSDRNSVPGLESDQNDVIEETNFESLFNKYVESSDSEDDSSDVDKRPLLEGLREWSVTCKVPGFTLNELLKVLRPFHPNLPKDPRTILKTDTKYSIGEKCGGQYYYFGIEISLAHKLKGYAEYLPEDYVMSLQINVDGLPLFKSTNHQFWPIIGRIQNIPDQDPFVIALYSGTSKPNDLVEYFKDFVEEFHGLHEGFHCHNKHFYVAIHSFICDAPARAFVKNVKSHSGYHGCDKCSQNGVWMGKMTFPETDARLRTDASFDEMRDEDHHLGPTPLSSLNLGLITQVPLDYMHLVCLGVVKRLLLLWMKGPLKTRLGFRNLQQISDRLVGLQGHIPIEFARKPRSLFEVRYWKATEFRQFLLYTGPAVLLELIHTNLYQNFMMLFVAMHILLNERLSEQFHNYANDLLVAFVRHFLQIYGQDMAVYNVHCLVHLAGDARNFGSLDNISSFPFENFLSTLKRMVRKPTFPLAQVIRRLSEEKIHKKETRSFPVLKKAHKGGLVPDALRHCSQYYKVETEKFTLKLNFKDSCIRIGGKVSIVKNIVLVEGCIHLVYHSFKEYEEFFHSPLKSSSLGIEKVSDLDDTIKLGKLCDIEAKCVLLPLNNEYIAIPFTDAAWSKTYAVVEFTEEEEVEVVPIKWLTDNDKKCAWPVYKSSLRIKAAVKSATSPTREFKTYPVRVFYKTSDYEQARRKLKLAEELSDLQTDADEESQQAVKKRAKKRNPRYESETDDEEEERTTRRKSPRKKTTYPEPPVVPPPPEISPLPSIRASSKTSTTPARPLDSHVSTSQQSLPSSPTNKSPIKTPSRPTLFSSPVRQGSNPAFERKLLTAVEEIRVQAHLNTTLLQNLLKKMDLRDEPTGDDVESSAIDAICKFPLETKTAIQDLEEKIQSDEFYKKLTRTLRTIGGEDVKSSVRRILGHLFTNEVAKSINWMGKGGKMAFSKLRLKDVIFTTVRKNRICTNATDSEMTVIIKDWFRYASDRDGGRKKREERKKERSKEVAVATATNVDSDATESP